MFDIFLKIKYIFNIKLRDKSNRDSKKRQKRINNLRKRKMYNILIYTVTAGNGHNTLAKSFKNALEKYYGNEVNVKIINFFDDYRSIFRSWIVDDGYRMSVKYALPIYNKIFKSMQKNMDSKKFNFSVNYCLYGKYKKILKTIDEFKPDCIICTHFFPAIALTRLKQKGKLFIPFTYFVTDYTVSPYMEYATGVTKLFSPAKDFTDKLVEIGYKPEQIQVIGYLSKIDVEEISREKGKRLSVLIMSGAGAFAGLEKQIKDLLRADLDVDVVLINGKDKKHKAKYDKYIKKLNNAGGLKHTKIENYGFVEDSEMLALLKRADCVVSKVGGNSLIEVVNLGRVLITTNKLAEQEWLNMQYLKKYADCFLIDKDNSLLKLLSSNIFNDDFFDKYSQDIKRIQVSNTSKNYVDAIIELCKEHQKEEINEETNKISE